MLFFPFKLEIKPRASHMRGKCSTVKLHSQLCFFKDKDTKGEHNLSKP